MRHLKKSETSMSRSSQQRASASWKSRSGKIYHYTLQTWTWAVSCPDAGRASSRHRTNAGTNSIPVNPTKEKVRVIFRDVSPIARWEIPSRRSKFRESAFQPPLYDSGTVYVPPHAMLDTLNVILDRPQVSEMVLPDAPNLKRSKPEPYPTGSPV